jgi:hypothetical protein
LHGFMQTGSSFRSRVGSLRKALKSRAEFEFVDAPFLVGRRRRGRRRNRGRLCGRVCLEGLRTRRRAPGKGGPDFSRAFHKGKIIKDI